MVKRPHGGLVSLDAQTAGRSRHQQGKRKTPDQEDGGSQVEHAQQDGYASHGLPRRVKENWLATT
jgi:hypothetical protein